jgi:phosphate transport system substrate-binding protein
MLFGPGADSGTFDYFTEAVVGRAKSSRVDFTASEDDNTLVQGVENNRTALGYFGFAYFVAHQDKMRAVPIDGGGGPVSPSIENVINGTYTPLARPLFVYVKESSMDRPEIKEFVEFMLTKSSDLVKEVGYVPLPATAYQLAWKHFQNRRLGSVFGGVPQVGITIDQLLAMDAKL